MDGRDDNYNGSGGPSQAIEAYHCVIRSIFGGGTGGVCSEVFAQRYIAAQAMT